MPKLEIELDEKGEFVGTLPTELASVLDKIRTTAHGEGYGKGAQKTAAEAKQQIEDAIRAEKLKLETAFPLEKAKWDDIDAQNKLLKTQLETSLGESRKRMQEREEAHALDITRRADAIAKRNEKIKGLVGSNVRALAAKAGAREESLSELDVILQSRIAFDDESMDPFVLAEDMKTPAKTPAGNPLSIEAFVQQYLDTHPHHRKPTGATGGNARGGAALHGGNRDAVSLTAATDRIHSGDRSAGAVNALFEASRRKAAS